MNDRPRHPHGLVRCRRPLAALALALAALLGAGACATKVHSAHDPAYDFTRVRTWRFRIDKGPASPSVDGRARKAIRTELERKGLRELPPGDETPDVLVSYAAGAMDALQSDWRAEPGLYGTVLVYPGAKSTVTGGVLIEMGDPRTGKAVWEGAYIMQGDNVNAMQVMLDRLEKAVREALAQYPPK
jgi:hypothetical protein